LFTKSKSLLPFYLQPAKATRFVCLISSRGIVTVYTGVGFIRPRSLTALNSSDERSSEMVFKIKRINFSNLLRQNYLNTFNPITYIRYIEEAKHFSSLHIDLSIYDILGQKVASLVDKKQPAGSYKVQ
jgi:hypothetical protein